MSAGDVMDGGAVPHDGQTVETAAGEEIVRLHRIIERWLHGPAGEDDFEPFSDALASGFTMVVPDGALLDRERVVADVRAVRGSEPGLEIHIHDVAVVAADASVVVATYREEHRGSASDRSRHATVVFVRDEHALTGLRWRHLHETWAS
ncbi:DUF4440 domain-containing protein [Phytoactinopolyspora halophila]|nr:DUF4440 domain-containing protein [Phytoactinopolyspora halophila]